MNRERNARAWIVMAVAALAIFGGPAVRAGSDAEPLGVRAAAGDILRAGYDVERQVLDATTVTVRVLYRGEVMATATGRIEAKSEKASPGRSSEGQAEDPFLARVESASAKINTP